MSKLTINAPQTGSLSKKHYSLFIGIFLIFFTITESLASETPQIQQKLGYTPMILRLSYDQKTSLTVSNQGQIDIRRYPSGQLWKTLTFPSNVTHCFFSPDDETVIIATQDELIRYNLHSEEKKRLVWTAKSTQAWGFSRNHRYLWISTLNTEDSSASTQIHAIRLEDFTETHVSQALSPTILRIWSNSDSTQAHSITTEGDQYTWSFFESDQVIASDRETIGPIKDTYARFGQPYLVTLSHDDVITIINKESGQTINSLSLPYVGQAQHLPIVGLGIDPIHQTLYAAIPPFIYGWKIHSPQNTAPTTTLYAPQAQSNELIIDTQRNRLLAATKTAAIYQWNLDDLSLSKKISHSLSTQWNTWKKQFPLEPNDIYKKRLTTYQSVFQDLFQTILRTHWQDVTNAFKLSPKGSDANIYELQSPLFKSATILVETNQTLPDGRIAVTPEWRLSSLQITPINPDDKPPYTIQKLTLNAPDGSIWRVSSYPSYAAKETLSLNRQKAFKKTQQIAKFQDGIETGGLIRHYLQGDGVTQNPTTALQTAELSTHPLAAFYKEQLSIKPHHRQRATSQDIRLLNLVTSLKEMYSKTPHPELSLAIGMAYNHGWGVPHNLIEARKWYQKDAKQQAMASWLHAELLRHDHEKHDPKYIFQLTKDAAKDGITNAAFQLGIDYQLGLGTPQSPEESLKWLTRAAHNGHTRAQIELATALLTGDGIHPNTRQAIHWLSTAEENGSEAALFLKFSLFDKLSPTTQISTMATITDRQDRSPTAAYLLATWMQQNPNHELAVRDTTPEKLLRYAATNGHTAAFEPFAELLIHINQDHLYDPEIMHWYEKASKDSKTGSASAHFKLNQLYKIGSVANKNLKTALLYLKSAAKDGHPEANFELAQFYKEHRALPESKRKYYLALFRATEGGHPEATLELAQLIQAEKEGQDTAAFLLEPLALAGHESAQYQLAQLFEQTKSPSLTTQFKATNWLYQAAYNGHPQAQFQLAETYPSLAETFYNKAAKHNHPEALFKLSQRLQETSPTQSIRYLIAATHQDHPQAMALFSTMLHENKIKPKSEPWAILSQSAIHTPTATTWDRKTGLLIFFELQRPFSPTPNYQWETERAVETASSLIQNGLTRLGTDQLINLIDADPLYFYQTAFWYRVYQENLPLQLIDQLLEKLPTTHQFTIPYLSLKAHHLLQQKQGEKAWKVIQEAESLLPTLPLTVPIAPYKSLLTIQKAIALEQENSLEEALSRLYLDNPFKQPHPSLLNYLRTWGKPLFKNTQQLAFALRMPEERLLLTPNTDKSTTR